MKVTRRRLLAGGSTALLAGCLDVPLTGGSSSAVTYPDRPDELTEDTVVEYVEAFEIARVREEKSDRYEQSELRIACGAVAMGDGTEYYSVVNCAGSIQSESGGSALLAGPANVVYRVTPDTTTRISSESESLGREPVDHVDFTDVELLATNFSDEEQTVSLALTEGGGDTGSDRDDTGERPTGGDTTVIFEGERTLAAESARRITDLGGVDEPTTLSASLVGSDVDPVRFTFTGTEFRFTFAAHVSPDEELIVGGHSSRSPAAFSRYPETE